MEFIKNQKKGFILYLIVAVLAIISLIIYISNVNTAYYADMNGSVVVLLIASVAAITGSIILSQFASSKVLKAAVDVLRVATAVFIIWAAGIFLSMRVESFGYIYGSNLELGNDEAFSAGGQAITGIVMLMVTWLASVLASFTKVGKKES